RPLGQRCGRRLRRRDRAAGGRDRRRLRRPGRHPAGRARRDRRGDARERGARRVDRRAHRRGRGDRGAVPDGRGMEDAVRGMATRELTAQTARAVSKSQRAYEWVRERILRQEFTPGYRLVLSAIGKELDMSVVPVREAVRRLEAEGLVVFERNVGARVGMIDRAGYEEAMESLAVLESAAISRAAAHLDAATLRRAREVNEVMRGSLDHFDAHMFTALNQQFHALLYRACPNRHLVDLTETEWSRLGTLRDSTFAFI